MLVLAYTLSTIPTGELIWLPLIAVPLAPIAFFSFLFIKKPSNVKLLRFLVWGVSIISLSDVLVIYFISDEAEPLALSMAVSVILLWVIYDLWYAKFASRDDHHSIKEMDMNNLVFKDADNKDFKPEEHLGLYNIYMFHRGNWCPLCMAQVRDIAKSYNKLESLGVKTFIISPSTEKMTANMAKKYEVNFHFLRDENLDMSRKLEIEQKNGVPLGMQVFGFSSDTIFPTLVITDSKNTIIFQGQSKDYRNRPEPETFIKIIEEYSKK